MVPYSLKFSKKNSFRKNSFFWILVLVGFCLLFLFLDIRILKKRESLNTQKELILKELERLQREKGEILEKISRVQTKEFLEERAREDLNLKKEGETVVAFPVLKEREEKTSSSSRVEEQQKPLPLWQKFLKWLKLK